MKIRILLFITLLFCIGCKHQQTDSGTKEKITLQTFACEGSCPVFSISIFSDGSAKFNGEMHVLEVGEHAFQFSDNEVSVLFDLIASIDFLKLESMYDSPIADLPETVIIYKEKRIVIKDLRNTPQDLKVLVMKLNDLAKRTGFIN